MGPLRWVLLLQQLSLLTASQAEAGQLRRAAANTNGTISTPSELRENSRSLLLLYILALLLMAAMYCYQKIIFKKYEKQVRDMMLLQTADKCLIKMLNNFSIKHVDEYRFRGIRPTRYRVSVGFKNLSATVKGGSKGYLPCTGGQEMKTVLAGVSGQFLAGRMSAIMGPSGAGKTTFLNVLCGKCRTGSSWDVSGSVSVNDAEVDITDLKPVMGFVPQDDVVHEGMTVRENIMYAAALRNPRTTTRARLRKITEDVVQVLQLEPQQNIVVGNRTRGGGLSGGQRKRVNVGMELAACPSLLFLDEPTSGLDSTSSLMLVKQLKKMTQLGMTIVMVIHQPRYSLFTLLDDVLLLGKGGRTAFIGPTGTAKEYLTALGFTMPPNENPADWMMDVLSGQLEVPGRIPKEELPERLFTEWEERHAPDPQYRRQASGRETTEEDNREVIKRHLRDEWNKVSPDAEALGKEDFAKVLLGCTGQKVDSAIVDELMLRMKGSSNVSAQPWNWGKGEGEDEVFITQRQFMHYLLSFQSLVTRDEALRRVYTCMMEELEDMEADGSSSGTDLGSDESAGEDGGGRWRSGTSIPWRQPGFCKQLLIVVHGRFLLWWRKQNTRMLFLLVVGFAGAFLGAFERFVFKSPAWMPTSYVNAHISIALLTAVYSLQCFSEDQPIFWREASHGLNRLAFLHGRMFVDTIDWLLMCFLFAATYYLITLPNIYFNVYFVPFLWVSFVASGWGYLISCWLPPALGPFVSALLCFVLGGILGLPDKMGTFFDSPLLETVVSLLSFTRWSVPMAFMRYLKDQPITPGSLDGVQQYMYNLYTEQGYGRAHWMLDMPDSSWWTGGLALLTMGTVLRVGAYLGLCVVNRSKQV